MLIIFAISLETIFLSKRNLLKIHFLLCDCSLSFKINKEMLVLLLVSSSFPTWCAYWMKTKTHSAFLSRFHLISSLSVHSIIEYHLLDDPYGLFWPKPFYRSLIILNYLHGWTALCKATKCVFSLVVLFTCNL